MGSSRSIANNRTVKQKHANTKKITHKLQNRFTKTD